MSIYGIPHPASTLLRTPEDVAEISDFPVVMKIISPDLTHKSEFGGIRLGISSLEAAAAAYDDIVSAARECGARVVGVEAQEMVQAAAHHKVTEVIVGMDRDPMWGPLVLVGAGGIYANYVKDVASELAKDYSPAIALAQLQRTRIWQILSGVRGEAKSDITSLVDTMVKVANLAINHPQIASLDINPLLVYEDQFDGKGVCAVDVKIILQSAAAHSE
jgi:acetyltransferase